MPEPRRRRVGVAADVARAIRSAPDAGPLVQARRKVVQHLADALEVAMRDGETLKVMKLNGQLEIAIRRAELEAGGAKGPDRPPAGEVTRDGDSDLSLEDELAELAAREPALGDTPQA